MLHSLYTAISSLNLHQNYLDVVANNLANANTTGYKTNRIQFQDQFYQLYSPGSSPTAGKGGVNPTQIGLGAQLGYVSPIFNQGTLQNTGRNLDLAIQGDGFFVYNTGDQQRYSRDGSITLDADGFMINGATGQRLQGWQADASGVVNTNLPTMSIEIDTDRTVARATAQVALGGNLDTSTVTNGTVDVTMGMYDSLGNLQPVTMQFTRTAASDWSWSVTSPLNVAATGTVSFDQNGQFVPGTSPQITIPGGTGAAAVNCTVDLSSLTMLAKDNSVSVTSQDGLPAGSVSDVYITPKDGSIYLVYTNGMSQQIGQVAIARFTNPAGLIQAGNTSFQQGLNSGEAQVGTADSGGRGSIASGYLEASNVDMAQEFTNMILAQRGFEASTKVITTSDEILQDLINLKR
jgi:flagellar hook protein FlgE